MAAALFNQLRKDGTHIAKSAGIFADGSPISSNAAEALMERGILPTPENDYIHHISESITDELIASADAVIGMTSSHAMQLLMRWPMYASKFTSMPHDISDPFGGSLDDYRKCLSEIEAGLSEMFDMPSDSCDDTSGSDE